MPDHFVQIFLEALHDASVVPMASEAAIYAMKSFGGFDMNTAVAAAIMGGMFGNTFNWWLGKMLMRLPSSPKTHRIYLKLQTLFNQYGFFLLFFAFVPLMNILVVAAGMFGTPLKKVLPLVALGLCYYYGRLLF